MKSKKPKTQTEEGPKAKFFSTDLSVKEALNPGVVKFFFKDISDKSERIKTLESKYENRLEEIIRLEKKVSVLETEDKYKTVREILIALAGLSGGAALNFLNEIKIWLPLSIITLIIFITYIFLKAKK